MFAILKLVVDLLKNRPPMKIIILNGPMGVGKTAVGKYIAEATPGTAFIDGDKIAKYFLVEQCISF